MPTQETDDWYPFTIQASSVGLITPIERLVGSVIASDNTCWEWIGAYNSDGYGKIWWKGKRRGAHALMYEIFIGPIPSGMELDHLCRQRGCVNPRHLEPVTHKENCHRGNINQFGKKVANV